MPAGNSSWLPVDIVTPQALRHTSFPATWPSETAPSNGGFVNVIIAPRNADTSQSSKTELMHNVTFVCFSSLTTYANFASENPRTEVHLSN